MPLSARTARKSLDRSRGIPLAVGSAPPSRARCSGGKPILTLANRNRTEFKPRLACAKSALLRISPARAAPARASLRYLEPRRAGQALPSAPAGRYARPDLGNGTAEAQTLAATAHEEMGFLAAGVSDDGAILHLDGNDPRLVLPVSEKQLAPLCRGGFPDGRIRLDRTLCEIDFPQRRALMWYWVARMVCRYFPCVPRRLIRRSTSSYRSIRTPPWWRRFFKSLTAVAGELSDNQCTVVW